MNDVAESQVDIRDEPGEEAYVIEVDGIRAGKAEYRSIEGRRVFTHTEVDGGYSGMGLATRLVRFALDDMRAQQTQVVPLCPFFAAYIRRHPEFDDLVDHELTMELKKRR
jgi:predicted GNAT family acetyltransferase